MILFTYYATTLVHFGRFPAAHTTTVNLFVPYIFYNILITCKKRLFFNNLFEGFVRFSVIQFTVYTYVDLTATFIVVIGYLFDELLNTHNTTSFWSCIVVIQYSNSLNLTKSSHQ